MRLTFMRLPQTIQLQPHVLQPEFMPERIGQQDQLCVNLSSREAQGLCTNLVELAITSALWPFMAKHRSHVVQTFATVIQQRVLRNRPDHSGSGLRPQTQMLSVESILKGVHLFFDDISDFTQTTHKECSGFDNGCSNISIGITVHQRTNHTFQPLPTSGIWRKNIVHPFNGRHFSTLRCRYNLFSTHVDAFLC